MTMTPHLACLAFAMLSAAGVALVYLASTDTDKLRDCFANLLDPPRVYAGCLILFFLGVACAQERGPAGFALLGWAAIAWSFQVYMVRSESGTAAAFLVSTLTVFLAVLLLAAVLLAGAFGALTDSHNTCPECQGRGPLYYCRRHERR